MTTFVRTTDGATVSPDEATAPDGTLRPGYRFGPASRTVRPDEYISFDIAFMDKAPASSATVFLHDTAPADPRAAVEAARRQWAADKAIAYLPASRRIDTTPAAAPPPSPPVPSLFASPRAPWAPRPTNDTADRAAVEKARSQWLADKQTAYRAPAGHDDA